MSNHSRIRGLILGGLALFLLAGFSQDRVVVRINGEKVVMGDLYQRIRSQLGENIDQAAIDRAVEAIITNRVIMQEARASGIPDVTEEEFRKAFSPSAMTLPNLADRAFQEDWVAAAMRARLVEKLMPTVPVSRKEIRTRFKELRLSLQPEQADVRWIVAENKEDADRVVARLKAGEDFGVVAKESTIIEKVSPEAARMAATVVPEKIHPELAEVIFAPTSKAGMLLPPVKVEKNVPFYGPKGYYIVEILWIVRREETTLEQWRPLVESTIRKEKAEKKVEAVLAKRRKQAKIWIEKDLFSLVISHGSQKRK
jgi:hypothetical protein